MATIKEVEPRSISVDEEALKEVEGYVERVEKQMEIKKPSNPLQPSSVKTPAPKVQDDFGNVVMQAAQKQVKAKIILPMDEIEVKEGLHHKIIDAARWLAEWCVLMIKKYPGRVFYKR
jgi:hypothetical protein